MLPLVVLISEKKFTDAGSFQHLPMGKSTPRPRLYIGADGSSPKVNLRAAGRRKG